MPVPNCFMAVKIRELREPRKGSLCRIMGRKTAMLEVASIAKSVPMRRGMS
jgi:hypothetical protein